MSIFYKNQGFKQSDTSKATVLTCPTDGAIIEKMIKHYPELEIYQPTIINGNTEKKDNMFNLFDTLHDPRTKRYFGEDFGFCQRWSDICRAPAH